MIHLKLLIIASFLLQQHPRVSSQAGTKQVARQQPSPVQGQDDGFVCLSPGISAISLIPTDKPRDSDLLPEAALFPGREKFPIPSDWALHAAALLPCPNKFAAVAQSFEFVYSQSSNTGIRPSLDANRQKPQLPQHSQLLAAERNLVHFYISFPTFAGGFGTNGIVLEARLNTLIDFLCEKAVTYRWERRANLPPNRVRSSLSAARLLMKMQRKPIIFRMKAKSYMADSK